MSPRPSGDRARRGAGASIAFVRTLFGGGAPQGDAGDTPCPAVRGTSVNTAMAALFGLGATVVFFLALNLPGISGTYVHGVFCQRGPIQFVTAFFFFWGVGILALKARRIRDEHFAFSRDPLNLDPGVLIRKEDALQHIRRLRRLPPDERNRLLTNRVWHALVRFKLLGNAEKVDDLLKYQGELDALSMESSYSFLKFIIALVPILGFLGTVLGISAAVAGFSGVVAAAQPTGDGGIDAIQRALGNVTIGLATAFDTTLIALIMSALLMFGVTVFQRSEEMLLAQIEDYCLENLLDRLWVPPVYEQIENAMTRAVAALPQQIAAELRNTIQQHSGPRPTPEE